MLELTPLRLIPEVIGTRTDRVLRLEHDGFRGALKPLAADRVAFSTPDCGRLALELAALVRGYHLSPLRGWSFVLEASTHR